MLQILANTPLENPLKSTPYLQPYYVPLIPLQNLYPRCMAKLLLTVQYVCYRDGDYSHGLSRAVFTVIDQITRILHYSNALTVKTRKHAKAISISVTELFTVFSLREWLFQIGLKLYNICDQIF